MLNSSTTPRQLAILLGVSYAGLTHTVYVKGVNSLYQSFDIPKKSGGTRRINSPKPQLFILQSRLREVLEALFKPHSAASAFIKNRGIIYNAKKHTRKEAVFNIDLEEFYDHIHFGRISGLLSSKPYSLKKETANLIANICCFKKRLPQGAPTSPIISNMICKGLDHRLSLLAKENQAQYSRYADDITFSFRALKSNSIYDYAGPHLVPADRLNSIITNYGFRINHSKTRINFKSERQTVTGLKVNSKVNLDRRYVRTTRAMLHSLRNGIDQANQKHKEINPGSSVLLENIVAGRISYIGMVKGVDSTVYQNLAQNFNSLPCLLRVRTKPKSSSPDLIQRMLGSIHAYSKKLQHSIFILDFDGIECDDEYVQGSAFVIEGNKIITAYHSFIKAGSNKYCFLYKVGDRSKKFKAQILNYCKDADVAELKIISEENPSIAPLKIGNAINSSSYGYKLIVAGFPQFQPGHESVSIIPCTVINTFNRKTFRMIEIDASIDAGNSGGPILNAYLEVVGMAAMGRSVTLEEDEKDENSKHVAYLEGNNAFISVEHLFLK